MPCWPGYLADPFILVTNQGYYAYGTDAPDEPVFSKTGRHFPVLFSQDMRDWQLIGGAVESAIRASYWAPEVAERDGRFYLYYSCGGEEGQNQRTRLAVADRPQGPFREVNGPLFPSLPFSIDASPFRDPQSGKDFLFFARDYFSGRSGTGLSVCALGKDMRPASKPKTVLRGSEDWEIFERDRLWYGRKWKRWYTAEGPCSRFREGRYFLFYSGGNWQSQGYGVNYAKARAIGGPYVPARGEHGAALLRSGMAGLRGPGHCSVFTTQEGEECIVFHAWNAEATKRQMYIARLKWDEQGLPGVVF